MKKSVFFLILILLTIIFVVSNVSASKIDLMFDDVSATSWYYDEVKTVYEAGIMEGKTSTSFDPTANMSRAEFITVLARLSGDDFEGKGTSLTFSDTDIEAWYADYVAWGVENDMVKGLPENKFAPNQAVSRQEMAVFIDRFISYINTSLTDNSKIDTFADVDKVADYAKEAVETMRKSGIITGDENGYFNPKSNASRAEVATVVTRILTLFNIDGDTDNTITGEFVFYDETAAPMPYYLYVPDNYNTNNQYPLIVYIRDRGTASIDSADMLFKSSDSPAHNSIVLVPQIPSLGSFEKLDELLEYISSKHSVDNQRKYLIATDNLAPFYTWKMLLNSPQSISAVIFVQGVSATLGSDSFGNIILLDDSVYNLLPDELKSLPISYIHCTDDTRSEVGLNAKYGGMLYEALINSKFETVKLIETTGYETICDNFITANDVSILEWLFAQQRETK